jgi:GT2 family glycosyltransferase
VQAGGSTRVVVLVINWNGRSLLEIVLPSLARQSYGDFRTVVIDNGSEDDSVEYLRREWPDVGVLELKENVGFVRANNQGIRATSSEFVVLLNNDIEADPRFLEELVAELDRHPEAASASPKMVDFGDRRMLDGAGDAMTWRGVAFRRGHGEPDLGHYDAPEAVFGACAGAAMYRRAALDDVGLLDEDFFMYLCDADWGFRAQLAGWSSRYVPAAVVYHMGGATSGPSSSFELFHVQRNNFALVLKNYPGRYLLRYGPGALLHQMRVLAGSLREGTTVVLLRAWGSALRQLPRTLRKRREVQRLRKASLEQLNAVILPRPPG